MKQNNGQLGSAIDLLREAVRLAPSNLAIRGDLANALKLAGRLDEAIACYRRVIKGMPGSEIAYSNMADALRLQGRIKQAIASCRRAIAINPTYPEAHYNLALALNEEGQSKEAVASYQRAITFRPHYAEAHSNLGLLLADQQALDEAIEHFRKAIQANPRLSEAHWNLGAALTRKGSVEEAVAVYRNASDANVLRPEWNPANSIAACSRSVAVAPNDPVAHFNLAGALARNGKNDEAIASLRKAIALQPNYGEALLKLGHVLTDIEKLEDAIATYHIVIGINSDHAEAYVGLGNALLKKGQLDRALLAYGQAMKLRPLPDVAEHNMDTPDRAAIGRGVVPSPGENFRAEFGRDAARMQDENLHYSIFRLCYSNILFCMNYSSKYDNITLFESHKEYDEKFGRVYAPYKHTKNYDRDRKLRVGYLSADFYSHSCANFIYPLLSAHDKNYFDIYCYSNGTKSDQVTSLIRTVADHWRDVSSFPDAIVAGLIHTDQIDILVDLSGHTKGNRLSVFSMKAAPIQVDWLGYPNTTGLTAIDYRFTDEIADPESEANAFATEKLVRLPNGFLCYNPLRKPPEIGPMPAKMNAHVTFGSFNNFTKISDDIISLWCQILDRVPGSRLILKSGQLLNDSTRIDCLGMFCARGIAAERIELLRWLPSADEHLSAYNRVDIALDTYPYNGTTTTCEALMMGVPVITSLGKRHAARVGASLLTHVGLTELIADDPLSYVETAVEFATDLAKLAALRADLSRRFMVSPVCDAAGFARQVEGAYKDMWSTWRRRQEAEMTPATTFSGSSTILSS